MPKTERWDKDIPAQTTKLDLGDGHHELLIEDLDYDRHGDFPKRSLKIDTPQGSFFTGAWNVINFLRENKPVIGMIFCFDVTGQLTARRFTNLNLKEPKQ